MGTYLLTGSPRASLHAGDVADDLGAWPPILAALGASLGPAGRERGGQQLSRPAARASGLWRCPPAGFPHWPATGPPGPAMHAVWWPLASTAGAEPPACWPRVCMSSVVLVRSCPDFRRGAARLPSAERMAVFLLGSLVISLPSVLPRGPQIMSTALPSPPSPWPPCRSRWSWPAPLHACTSAALRDRQHQRNPGS
jgi:hypothetical protein